MNKEIFNPLGLDIAMVGGAKPQLESFSSGHVIAYNFNKMVYILGFMLMTGGLEHMKSIIVHLFDLPVNNIPPFLR